MPLAANLSQPLIGGPPTPVTQLAMSINLPQLMLLLNGGMTLALTLYAGDTPPATTQLTVYDAANQNKPVPLTVAAGVEGVQAMLYRVSGTTKTRVWSNWKACPLTGNAPDGTCQVPFSGGDFATAGRYELDAQVIYTGTPPTPLTVLTPIAITVNAALP